MEEYLIIVNQLSANLPKSIRTYSRNLLITPPAAGSAVLRSLTDL